MDDKENRVLRAAVETIAKYGVRRATMGDIAELAQVSRQTLYARYANKDDMIAAAIEYLCRNALAEIAEAWRAEPDISGRLDAYFRIAIVDVFDMMRKSPDSEDVISGSIPAAKEAVKRAEAQKRKVLEDLFRPSEARIAKSGQTLEQFAEFVQVSAAHMKYAAADRETLLRLLASLKAAVLAIIGRAQEQA